MIKSNLMASSAHAIDDFALLSLRVFWCTDCQADQLFERPVADLVAGEPGEAGAWACTACGAAYFDGIDVVFNVEVLDRAETLPEVV